MMQTSGMCPQFVISSFLLEWLSLSALHQQINKKSILLKITKKVSLVTAPPSIGAEPLFTPSLEKNKNKNWPHTILHFWEIIPINNIQ